jgi:hypothetical protein
LTFRNCTLLRCWCFKYTGFKFLKPSSCLLFSCFITLVRLSNVCISQAYVKFMIYKTWHQKLTINQDEPYKNPEGRQRKLRITKEKKRKKNNSQTQIHDYEYVCINLDIWMEIPIQHDIYIWANYSVSSYLNFIPICWNVLIWLKYDFMHIFMHLKRLFTQKEESNQTQYGALCVLIIVINIFICKTKFFADFIPICWNVLIWLKYDFMHIFMHHLSLYFDL